MFRIIFFIQVVWVDSHGILVVLCNHTITCAGYKVINQVLFCQHWTPYTVFIIVGGYGLITVLLPNSIVLCKINSLDIKGDLIVTTIKIVIWCYPIQNGVHIRLLHVEFADRINTVWFTCCLRRRLRRHVSDQGREMKTT